ncbi:MAG: DUF3549 family protein [Candidatus Thiodiazotropha lotti]|uniref:DUF3549 family protein n=1 Tax=Candidatus Thiodiazotropha lotti TaxID=2792787 RepID=A0A9E4K428_9GAMM|nr:DUF3549 family protein [Candidatus Thiodiazotropha lotti]ODB99584.1 hypothetical protein A3197_11690 [Candidatus Thiodiazotropha endoloripes]MCG7932689.1 DUF3549 family protein [Candidatus Thiodiazotropha lotti]MCG7938842.1 DUF3549 family protein [Candidatus Thiodiazotropha lotti]MCG7988488.1 DUF3549 family protein [Candidatus Thiodiazotropha lotti]
MNQIATLTEFLESGGLQLNYYDMGRRVTPIQRDVFVSFELTDTPYPAPLQQQAWFALILSDPQQKELDPMIWFVRFPLDEQAKLLQAARDDFLHRLMENLGQSAAGKREEMQAAIQDNPYLFQPKEERLAIFHARFTASLNRPVSRHYEHAKAYFQGELGWDQWSFVGYQGIADLAARIGSEISEDQIVAAIAELPAPPLEALCHCLENEFTSKPITLALIKRARQTMKQPQADLRIISSVIRGISQSIAVEHRNELILKALEHPISSHSELLVAISGRAWECLSEQQISEKFLQRLAENEVGQELFDGVLSDLLYMPSSRTWLQSSLRNPQRSEQLNRAISHFFDSLRQPGAD